MTEEILQRMLDDIDDSLSKDPGGFVYEALQPVANEINNSLNKLATVEKKFNVENMEGQDLETYINQRTGITRREATYAVGEVTVTGNGSVTESDLFETESGTQFEATESIAVDGSATVSIRAIEVGESGNVPANQITQMPVTLDGIDSVTNPDPTYDGFEAETDADLLARYYESIRTPATSGNIAHYLNWSKEVSGVGEAKVFPLDNGDNTVTVLIIDSNRLPASTQLVSEVQEYIDPNSSGLGEGKAPIGAYVTVDAATALTINVEFTLTLKNSANQTDTVTRIEDNIASYFADIAFDENEGSVSYAQIGSLIFNTEGVDDYQNLLVNDGTSNIPIGDREVPVVGDVIAN